MVAILRALRKGGEARVGSQRIHRDEARVIAAMLRNYRNIRDH
jgi:transcriptional regulator with GAF, ATPase, and Fis domain